MVAESRYFVHDVTVLVSMDQQQETNCAHQYGGRCSGIRGQLRDFVYVRDCVDVVLWLLDNPQVSGLFNLGTGKARSWLDLAKALFAATGRKPAIEFIEMPPVLIEKYQYFTQARMDRLRSAGYERAFTSLEEGITDYVHHYLAAEDPYR